MKFTVAALSTAVAALSLIQPALAHYRFTSLIGPDGTVTGEYEYVRKNTNNNSPVENLLSQDMRCNVGGLTSGSSTSTLTVAAGSTLGFKADQAAFHPGPFAVYLGQVPAGSSAAEWDGSGAAWFKISEKGAIIGDGTFSFDATITEYSTTIPSSIPSGDYLFRIEHWGLHSAGAPQAYISCAQITVTGGGSASPSKVEIPGYLAADEPGLMINIYYPVPTSYTVPGPAVFTDGSSGGSPVTSAVQTSAVATSAVETSAAAEPTTDAAEPTSVAQTSAVETSVVEVPATSEAPATSAVETSAPAPTSAPAQTSAPAATSAASSAPAPAPSSTCTSDGYNCCYREYNSCADRANAQPNRGGNVDFSACEAARTTCLASLTRRHARQWSLN